MKFDSDTEYVFFWFMMIQLLWDGLMAVYGGNWIRSLQDRIQKLEGFQTGTPI